MLLFIANLTSVNWWKPVPLPGFERISTGSSCFRNQIVWTCPSTQWLQKIPIPFSKFTVCFQFSYFPAEQYFYFYKWLHTLGIDCFEQNYFINNDIEFWFGIYLEIYKTALYIPILYFDFRIIWFQVQLLTKPDW